MIEAQRVRAVACEAGMGKAGSGAEQVAVSFELLEGPNAGEKITWYGYFSEKTWERTVESLRACGWEGDDLAHLDGIDRNEVLLVIEHEPNQDGKVFAKVRWVNKLGGGGVALKEALEGRELQSFAAQMKGRIKALSAGKPSAKPASRPAPARQPPPARRQPEPPASDYDDRGENGPPPPGDDDVPPWVRS